MGGVRDIDGLFYFEILFRFLKLERERVRTTIEDTEAVIWEWEINIMLFHKAVTHSFDRTCLSSGSVGRHHDI